MRNNEERMSQDPKQTSADLPPQFMTPGLSQELNFVTPTEFVPLPSKGKYYPETHPLFGKDSIEVRQMTAKEEDILTSKSLLKKGVAIDRMLESIIVDKKIKPSELLIGDKNAVLIAARISGYGQEYQTSIVCPSCEKKMNHTFDLSEYLERAGEERPDVLPEGCERLASGNVVIRLPKTNWVVECRLMTGADETRIVKMIEARKRFNDSDDSKLSDQLETMIVSIQGVTDSFLIKKAIQLLPALDSKHLRKCYQQCVPGVDLKTTISCSSCDSEQEMEVPFTADFFWPK
jgi:hypothetical protein